jgi:hypothetical protein
MSKGNVFWVIMILWVVFGLYTNWPAQGQKPWPLVGNVVLWVLFGLLGWAVFGGAVH